MFRDLKEYQDIAKIYADKVSKPENLEERRGASPEQLAANRKDAFKGVPNSASNKRAEMSKARRGDKKFVFNKPTSASNKRAEMSIKRRDQSVVANKSKVVPGTRVNEIGAEGGGKPSEGNFKKDFPDKPKVSTMTKQGKPRTKAQMMAAKRIASGKTISDVKAENQASMKARAKAKFAAFKARRAEKKLDKQRDFDDPDKKMNRGESYTPYDIVLEYLLSSEQVATIEEANYVMTEMDAETIQGIVEMQGQINRADIIGGTQAAKNAAKGIGKYTPGKGVTKDFKLDPNFKLPGV